MARYVENRIVSARSCTLRSQACGAPDAVNIVSDIASTTSAARFMSLTSIIGATHIVADLEGKSAQAAMSACLTADAGAWRSSGAFELGSRRVGTIALARPLPRAGDDGEVKQLAPWSSTRSAGAELAQVPPGSGGAGGGRCRVGSGCREDPCGIPGEPVLTYELKRAGQNTA